MIPKTLILGVMMVLVVFVGGSVAAAGDSRVNSYLNSGDQYYSKDDYDQAISNYTRAIELDSTSGIAYLKRANAYFFGTSNYDQAILDYTQAIALNLPADQQSRAYTNRGYSYYYLDKTNHYDQAISDCNQAIELNPKNADAYYYRALFYRKKEFPKRENIYRALDDINQSLAIDDHSALAYAERGNIYRYRTEYAPEGESLAASRVWIDRGLADFDTALTLDPNNKYIQGCKRDALASKKDLAELDAALAAWQAQGVAMKEEQEAKKYLIGDEVLVIQWYSDVRNVKYGYSAVVRSIDPPYVTLEIVDFYNVNSFIEGGPATGGETLYKSSDIGKLVTIKATEITSFGRILKKQQPAASNADGIPWVDVTIHLDSNPWDLVDWQVTNYAQDPTAESPGKILDGKVTTSGTAVHRNNGAFSEGLAGKYKWQATYRYLSGEYRSFSGVFTLSGTKQHYSIRIHEDGSDDGSYEW